MPDSTFDKALTTPFLRDLDALCKKHGVTKLVAGYEDPDQLAGKVMVFIQKRGGVSWSLDAAGAIMDFIDEHSNADHSWRM